MVNYHGIDQIRERAWVSDAWTAQPIRAVIFTFEGLNETALRQAPSSGELDWTAAGGLVVQPYTGPWSWMNRQTRAFTDDVVDAVYETFNLSSDVPLIAVGGSMGGCSALLWTRYSRHRIAACMAVFPACDLTYHMHEGPNLPRTMHFAFRGYPEPLDDILCEHSPLYQAAAMPDIPYLVIHGDADKTVSKAHHSDRLVAAMRQAGRRVEYVEVPGIGHDSLMPMSVILKRIDWVREFFNKG